MTDVGRGQIWEIDGHPARVMMTLFDEVEVQFRDRPNAPNDLQRTQRFSAKAMAAAPSRFKLLRSANEMKTKTELENLIQSKIANHPVCPPGMRASVRGLGGGAWDVDSTPPAGISIAYADCTNYVARVALELRQTFDLGE